MICMFVDKSILLITINSDSSWFHTFLPNYCVSEGAGVWCASVKSCKAPTFTVHWDTLNMQTIFLHMHQEVFVQY
jgi:hypothetical protein